MTARASFLSDLMAFSPQILAGLGNTLLLAGIVSATGLAGGVLLFYGILNGPPSCRRWIERYVSFFIGTPLLVHLFLMYYGLPRIGVTLSPLAVAVIGFTLNVSAYNARSLRMAYGGLDPAELEAAAAQGFRPAETFRFVVLPQVLRLALPALTNQAIHNLKDTSVAFLIQYSDFFAQIQEVAAMNFQFLKTYLLAGGVYLLLVSAIILAARGLERRVRLPGFAA